jgi:flagellar motor switch protein FliM
MNRRSSNRSTTGPVPYDFRRPTKLTREHVRMLQMAYETFARRYTTLLTSSLRVASQVTLIAIEQITYDEYISGLDNPTCMFMVELEPMPAKSIFEMSSSMPLVWVDHMLGGPGGKQPERPLTDIETPLVYGVLERILDELRFSFESIVDLTPRIVGLEYNPQFAQAAAASDAVIIVSFEMRVGAEECIGTVCTPFAGLLPHLATDSDNAGLNAAQRQARDAAQRSMTAGLGNTPVEVSVRFNSVLMSPRDLVTLRPGDIVPLEHPLTNPLAVTSAGVTFAHAVAGSSGQRLACLVVPPPQEDSP